MRVDRQVDLLEGQAILDGKRRLRDEVGRTRSYDVRAQQLARLCVGDHLDEAFSLAERESATGGSKRESADLHCDALALRLLLTEPDVRDLGIRIDTVGGGVVVRHAVCMT